MADDVLIIDDGDRYGRFRLISWWRQEKLAAAKVLVVGAGALGNEVLKNLALLGVGHVYIIDYDTIESTNLTRSVLYRASDAGKSKAERAAAAVKALNPDVKVHAVNGNVIADLGLGVYEEVDVVIGCLDNREARLWINRQCWKVNKPWVDGAIQEISGVVKVFVPPDSACYECGMTERDYQLINLKYSCPLLKREDIAEGKVPTAPTISSMIAGLQTQEALKILHGMSVKAGAAMVWNGESNNFYTTSYQRKDNCLSHETYGRIERADEIGCSVPVETIFAATDGTRLLLDRDLLVGVECPSCKIKKSILRPVALVTLREGNCEKCGAVMRTNIVHVVEAGTPLAKRTLREVGVSPFDIIKIEGERRGMYIRLEGDRAQEMEWS
jgi:molybdopterin-synthase adenylyltransferase